MLSKNKFLFDLVLMILLLFIRTISNIFGHIHTQTHAEKTREKNVLKIDKNFKF